MQVTEVVAGRELDAQIAEKVMGLQVVAHDWPCGYDMECGYYSASNTRDAEYGHYPERGPVFAPVEHGWPPHPLGNPDSPLSQMYPNRLYAVVEPVRFYSTDIEAAWDVVDHLRAHGFTWQLMVYRNVCEYYEVSCFWGGEGDQQHVTRSGDTIPLVICRAALATLDTPAQSE